VININFADTLVSGEKIEGIILIKVRFVQQKQRQEAVDAN
jgi:hypothetical protein